MRASKKLRSDELLLTAFGSTRLRKQLDDVPLWRGDHVAVRQLVEDFARYLYLPRLRPGGACESDAGRLRAADVAYRHVRLCRQLRRGGGPLPQPQVRAGYRPAGKRLASPARAAGSGAEATGFDAPASATGSGARGRWPDGHGASLKARRATQRVAPKRFHGTVALSAARVGRDASQIADEVISHLAGLVGSKVTVTLEIEAEVSGGVPENVMRTVTENSRTLRFTTSGFEKE